MTTSRDADIGHTSGREPRGAPPASNGSSSRQAATLPVRAEQRGAGFCTPGFPLARITLSATGDAVEVGDLWYHATGLAADASLGTSWMVAIDPDHREAAVEELARAASCGESGTADWLVAGPDGGRWMRWWWRPVDVDRLEVCLADIDDDKQRERLLWDRATHDALTGLVDRAEFLDLVDRALDRTRAPDALTVVFFIDLDGFKLVNDTHGHRVGDEVLQLVAKRLRRTARLADVVARVGGDEFTVLSEEVNGLAAAAQQAMRLREVISRPIFAGGRRWRVHASIGFAIGQHGTDTAADLVGRADDAMYATRPQIPQSVTHPCALGPVEASAEDDLARLVPRLLGVGLTLGSAASTAEGITLDRIQQAADELDEIARDIRREPLGRARPPDRI